MNVEGMLVRYACWESQGFCFVSCLDDYSLCWFSFCMTRRCWCLCAVCVSLCTPMYVQECTYTPCFFTAVKKKKRTCLEKSAHASEQPRSPSSLPDLTFFPLVHVQFQDESLHSLVSLRAQRNDRIPHPCLATTRAMFDSVLVALTLKT